LKLADKVKELESRLREQDRETGVSPVK
jgi:hypothetical protein